MAEYIKLEDAIREIEQINPVDYGAMWDYEAHHWAGECLRDCKEAIDSIPAADVAPVVHARWIYVEETLATSSGYCCSACRRPRWLSPDVPEVFKYCPECGAKMDGERKDGGRDHDA